MRQPALDEVLDALRPPRGGVDRPPVTREQLGRRAADAGGTSRDEDRLRHRRRHAGALDGSRAPGQSVSGRPRGASLCKPGSHWYGQRLPRHGLQSYAEPATHRLPDEGQPAAAGAGDAAALERDRAVPPDARPQRRTAALRAARRPAVRQRQHPPRPHAQQGAEGHRRQIALDGGMARALRPGLGLPRLADRAPGREAARTRQEGGDAEAGGAGALPRVRRALRRRAA